jgi:predicted outer membrane lipoprotein
VLLHTGPALGQLRAASGDTVTAVLGVLLAVALTFAALWLEDVCKVPPEDEEQPGTGPGVPT